MLLVEVYFCEDILTAEPKMTFTHSTKDCHLTHDIPFARGITCCFFTNLVRLKGLRIIRMVFYGHVLMRDYGHVLRRAFDFEVEGQWKGKKRKKGISKRTWKKLVEEESMKVGLRREDALCCSKWSVDINKIAAGLR